jgi:alanine racemase
VADTLGKKEYPVHIKLDTGMHRLGFERKDMAQLVATLQKTNTIKIASIFSHLAASDDAAEDAFTAHQARLYDEMSGTILRAIPYLPLQHLCNTAGITRHKHLQYSMVRLGLGLYGIDSSSLLKNKLQHISTLKTSIAQIRDVPAGDSIGYGHKTFAPHDMRLATISIGYADGYPRSMGHGKAHVLINGQPAPTVGIICMDMCMVDITNLANVNEGDEVIVMGSDLPATQLARWADTISYEIMAGISQRVKRVYVNGE